MKKNKLDDQDCKLAELLAEDGRMPVGDIATRLGVTAPTVRTRIKNLEAAGILKIAGFINPARHQKMTIALIGINIIARGKLDDAINKLAEFEFVMWTAAVTGRYDLIAEVVFEGGMDELYRITSVKIPTIGDVVKSETFVIMKSSNKWVEMRRKQTAQRNETK